MQGFFFRVRGRHPTPVKRGKMHDKGHIWGKFSVNVVSHILYLCDPHYTLLYYQLYRYLVSLYQIIWIFIDPENGGFWKTYLDKEKMLETSSFSCYYNVFYSTLTKFNFCHLQMLSITCRTYQNFCHFVWRYEALKYIRAFCHG